jgi:hypothetical protein
MMSCIGSCFAGDVARSHARLDLSASYRCAFSSDVSALTALELAVLFDLVLGFDVWMGNGGLAMVNLGLNGV